MHAVYLVVIVLLLGGCASAPERASAPAATVPHRSLSDWQQALQAQFHDWKGAPYRLGGLSKSGIDCSGFVQITYRNVFGLQVPRSTELLANSGEPVARERLRPGDLVFFNTGDKERHVGIYLSNGEFIHASSSRGVMKSRLDDPYWKDSYWKSARLVAL